MALLSLIGFIAGIAIPVIIIYELINIHKRLAEIETILIEWHKKLDNQ
ncbi:MAG: hypothetical protein ACM3UZ_03350 [Acidobacteriota bacterium]